MKKRILASFLSLVLVLSLVPTSALAVDEEPGGEPPVVCAGLAGCVEDAHDEGCPLYVAPVKPADERDGDANNYYEFEDVTGGEDGIMLTAENDDTTTGQGTQANPWNISADGEGNKVYAYLKQNNNDMDAPTYTLIFYGQGQMADIGETSTPWRKSDDYQKVNQVEISEGITHIGSGVCGGMSNLKSCTIPASVKSIGSAAFSVAGLETLNFTVGSSLEEIGDYAFYKCQLTSIDFSNTPKLKKIGNRAFPEQGNTGAKTLTSLKFGEYSALESIGARAFAGNTLLTGSLTIPSNVTTIGEGVFDNTSYSKIVTGKFVTTIGQTAFSSNSYLQILMINSDKLNSIGTNVLQYSTSVHTVYIAGNPTTIGGAAFNGLANNSIIYSKQKVTALDGTNVVNKGMTAFSITNGGTFADGTSFTSGTLATPTKEGYEFGGWYSDSNFSGSAVTSVTAGQTYYAKWVRAITFDGNGATGGSMAVQQVTEGDNTTTLTSNAFTKIGYTFTGWNTVADGTGTSYVADAVASTVPNSTTLYAQWTPNTYTIQFNGGTGANGFTASATATYDQPVTLTANGFTMAGKNFAGWATSQEKANAGTVEYSDQTEVLNLAESGTVTLYAVWTDKQVLDPDLTDTVVTYNGQPQKFHVDGTYTVKYYQNRVEVTAPTNAGIYDVEISRAEDDTYAAYHGRVVGGLVINKASLTIKADDQSIRVGNELPQFTYTVSGWQGSDGDTVTIEGVSAVCTNADANTVGDYTITVSGPATIDNYTITYVDGTLTVSKRSSGGSSSSGSSSSTTTETEKNPDGSTTTTVTDKKTGTVTETTKFKDGSTLVVETKKDGTITTTETAKNGVKVRTVDEPGEDVTATVTIPRSVGEAVVTIPADVGYGTVAVDADTGEIVKLSVPTEAGMTVKLDGSAELVLVDRSLDFTDTNNHWAEDAIDFATAHELFAGTSDTTFSPDSSMTRAMLMTVLARFDGQDTTGGAVWYDKAMAWAKENGISDGSNPDGNITREQFATMLWRYAGSPAVSGMALNEFGDSASVNGYAVDAMRWAVSSGIIGGTDAGLLMPQGNATRAQVATMLMRFVEGLTK